MLEIRDLWPETLIALGTLRRGHWFARLLLRLERRLVTAADRVVTTMPRAWEYLAREHGVLAEKVEWISNGIDVGTGAAVGAPTPSPVLRLSYLGAHGTANALDTLVDALTLLGPDFAIDVRLYGEGAEKARLEAVCADRGILQTSFEAPVAKDRLADVARVTDAFVMCSRNLPELYKYGVSMNKLFDYMYLGRPIVAALAAADDPVTAGDAGIVVPPESPKRLAEAIRQMAAMPVEARIEMGERARRYVIENFGYEHLGAKFASVLESVR